MAIEFKALKKYMCVTRQAPRGRPAYNRIVLEKVARLGRPQNVP